MEPKKQKPKNKIKTSKESPETMVEVTSKQSWVPTEMMVEVLSRLHLESLFRCKSVCKSWRSLISEPYFIKYYNAKHQLVFTHNFYPGNKLNICHLSDVLHEKSVANAITLGLDEPVKPHRGCLSIAGSCNGLLCTVIHREIPVICNPLTRTYNRLSCAFDNMDDSYVLYGFGYDEPTEDYKLIALSIRYDYLSSFKSNKVKIYSLKTGRWKEIGKSPYGSITRNGVIKYSNGSFHWLATPTENKWTIVSLDLATETFGQVLQPEYDEGYIDLTFGTLGERLCVLSNQQSRSDLWVMNVYGVKDSWTKLVSIPFILSQIPLFISNDGKILFKYHRGLVVYDFKTGSSFKIQNFDQCGDVSMFAERLVSPHSCII